MARARRTHRHPTIADSREAPPAALPRRGRLPALLVFTVAFLGLEVNSYTLKSATWDEPIHLTSGYAALANRDYRIDPTHPPFLRLWAALPLLAIDGIRIETTVIDRAEASDWLTEAYSFSQRFLYTDNDADRLLYASRFMVAIWGVVLGVLLFCWVHEWLGGLAALTVLVFYTLEPNLAAHASLVTTDLGVTCFIFGTVYFLWRLTRRATARDAAGVATCFALAIVTKFSAVVLVPIVALLLVVAIRQRSALTPRRAWAVVGVTAAVTCVAVWAVYGFRYAPSASTAWLFHLDATSGRLGSPAMARMVGWIDARHLLPNAFTQGFYYSHTSARELGMFLWGSLRTDGGWWYYFPLAFLIKTPLTLIVLALFGIIALATRRHGNRTITVAFIGVPIAIYLGVAMMSGINIGLRHILPIYPFVLLLGAAAVNALVERSSAGRMAVGALIIIAAVEFATAYPYTLTFFNQLVGGPRNGFRYLSDSNIAWGQTLKPLKRWMTRNGVAHVNLAYFGQADPAYYGIDCTYLPGSPAFAVDRVARPRLPGYVAISSTVLSGVYLAPPWRLFYAAFIDRAPVAVIGNSLRIYWVDEWPEAIDRYASVSDPAAQRALADALLFGLRWPSHALVHYQAYVKDRPADAAAHVNSGVALAMMNRTDEALAVFARAVDIAPDDGNARLTLAQALFGAGDLDGAAVHAERAIFLTPHDPDALDLLGRVRGVQGRLEEAARLFERALQIDPAHRAATEGLRHVRAMGVHARVR